MYKRIYLNVHQGKVSYHFPKNSYANFLYNFSICDTFQYYYLSNSRSRFTCVLMLAGMSTVRSTVPAVEDCFGQDTHTHTQGSGRCALNHRCRAVDVSQIQPFLNFLDLLKQNRNTMTIKQCHVLNNSEITVQHQLKCRKFSGMSQLDTLCPGIKTASTEPAFCSYRPAHKQSTLLVNSQYSYSCVLWDNPMSPRKYVFEGEVVSVYTP